VRSKQGRCSKNYISKRNIWNIKRDPPVVVEDRQLVVLAAHDTMRMRRLMNAHRQGQATVAKIEAARWQNTINQKVAAKMFTILL
jgi:hypothetical protein